MRNRISPRTAWIATGAFAIAIAAGFAVSSTVTRSVGSFDHGTELQSTAAENVPQFDAMSWVDSLYGVDAFVHGEIVETGSELIETGADTESSVYREHVLRITDVVAVASVGARFASDDERTSVPPLEPGTTMVVRDYLPPSSAESVDSIFQFGDTDPSSLVIGLAYLEYDSPGHWALTMSLAPSPGGYALARTGEEISELATIIESAAIADDGREDLLADLLREMDAFQEAVDTDPNADIFRGRFLSILRPDLPDREAELIDEYWTNVDPALRGLESQSPMPIDERARLVTRPALIDVSGLDDSDGAGLFVVVRSAGGISHIAELAAGSHIASLSMYPDLDMTIAITDDLTDAGRLGTSLGGIKIEEWSAGHALHVLIDRSHTEAFRGVRDVSTIVSPARAIAADEFEALVRGIAEAIATDEG